MCQIINLEYNCTVVTSPGLRRSNHFRGKKKILNRETKIPQEEPKRKDPSSEDGQTCKKSTEHNNVMITVYLECIKHP